MKVIRFYGFTKYKVKTLIPKSAWALLSKKVEIKREKEFAERKIFKNKGHEKPEIYVIRRRPPGGGLFSNVNHVLQGVEYARANDLTPIVDMQNYWTSYSQRKPLHQTKNAWEYFFEPISNLKINELELFRNVTLSKGDRINPSSPLADRGLKFVLNNHLLQELHSLYIENIRLNKQTFKFLNRVKEYIEWDRNTIGVSYRGTDYVSTQPTGHAKQPTLPQLISRLENKQGSYSGCRLLVSTEDAAARSAIIKTNTDSVYREFRDHRILEKLISNNEHVSKQAMDALGYLAEIYLLAECITVTCSIANGSATSLIINGGKYIEPEIIDLGIY
jgi:hypothetical protein